MGIRGVGGRNKAPPPRNIMAATPIVHRTTAVLKIPARKSGVASFATSVINAMTGNASFPNPTPPLATVSADLAAYEAAEAQAVTRVKGAAAALAEKQDDRFELREYREES